MLRASLLALPKNPRRNHLRFYCMVTAKIMKMMRFTETALAESQPAESVLTPAVRTALLPVARRVFWWGQPKDWLDDPARFVAQVMTYGDWNDTTVALELLGEASFKQVLQNPPAGVFDIKSWVYWHHRFQLEAPPLPGRRLP